MVEIFIKLKTKKKKSAKTPGTIQSSVSNLVQETMSAQHKAIVSEDFV